MAFCIQLWRCPELMGIYLVSSKMRCRFVTFGSLPCGDTLVVGESFASRWDPQQDELRFSQNEADVEEFSSNDRGIWHFYAFFICLSYCPLKASNPLVSAVSQVGIFQECFCRSVECRQDGACLWSSSYLQNSVCANLHERKKTQDIKKLTFSQVNKLCISTNTDGSGIVVAEADCVHSCSLQLRYLM